MHILKIEVNICHFLTRGEFRKRKAKPNHTEKYSSDIVIKPALCLCFCVQNNSNIIEPINVSYGGRLPTEPGSELFYFEKKKKKNRVMWGTKMLA